MTTKAKPREGTLAWARVEVRGLLKCPVVVQRHLIFWGSGNDMGFWKRVRAGPAAIATKPKSTTWGEDSRDITVMTDGTWPQTYRAVVAAVKEAAK